MIVAFLFLMRQVVVPIFRESTAPDLFFDTFYTHTCIQTYFCMRGAHRRNRYLQKFGDRERRVTVSKEGRKEGRKHVRLGAGLSCQTSEVRLIPDLSARCGHLAIYFLPFFPPPSPVSTINLGKEDGELGRGVKWRSFSFSLAFRPPLSCRPSSSDQLRLLGGTPVPEVVGVLASDFPIAGGAAVQGVCGVGGCGWMDVTRGKR